MDHTRYAWPSAGEWQTLRSFWAASCPTWRFWCPSTLKRKYSHGTLTRKAWTCWCATQTSRCICPWLETQNPISKCCLSLYMSKLNFHWICLKNQVRKHLRGFHLTSKMPYSSDVFCLAIRYTFSILVNYPSSFLLIFSILCSLRPPTVKKFLFADSPITDISPKSPNSISGDFLFLFSSCIELSMIKSYIFILY